MGRENAGRFSVIYLLDVDALIGLTVIEHAHRPRIMAWLATLDPKRDALGSCSITELGLVRVLSLPMGANFEIPEAQSALARLKATSTIPFTFFSDELGAECLPKWVKTSKQTTDGHLLELAKAHKAVLATCDQKIPGAFLIHA